MPETLGAARTEGGLGLFLVDKPSLVPAGIVDGGGNAEFVVDNLPAEWLSADALDDIEMVFDLGRIALCAEAVGAMSQPIDLTIDYLKQPKQFDRSVTMAAVAGHDTADRALLLMARNPDRRGGPPYAWRYRHDLGLCRIASCQAPGDDRQPSRRSP